MDLLYIRTPMSYCEYYFQFEKEQRRDIEGDITVVQ